jgi:phosphomannomutase/phosphoglucomutase
MIKSQNIMNANIFREYDIRGIANRDIPNDLVHALGLAISETASSGSSTAVVVARDCRLTSPRIFTALTDGLLDKTDVIDIGIVPTPVAYFAQQFLLPAATVMITGSHNPAEDNGFKIMIGATTLHGEAIAQLGRRVADLLGQSTARRTMITQGGRALIARDGTDAYLAKLLGQPSLRPSLMTIHDVTDAYLARATAAIQLGSRRFKVVVDAGNGAGGPTAVALYERLGFDVVPLYCDFDGRFPHHHPDPTQPENLADLITAVGREGAELGIALDGDADRLGVVDATGRILWGDQLMILLGRAVLSEVPGARFVGEVKCSQALYDELAAAGGTVEMWKVGHSLIKERMKEIGAQLAGEMSGHMFFAHRWLGFDDGIYAGARLLELLSRGSQTLAELAGALPVMINTPEIRIDCADDRKVGLVAAVTERLRLDPAVTRVIDIDGVRATFADGWGLLRASNTQPALVMRCEASSAVRLAEIKTMLEAHLAVAKDEQMLEG